MSRIIWSWLGHVYGLVLCRCYEHCGSFKSCVVIIIITILIHLLGHPIPASVMSMGGNGILFEFTLQ